MPSARASRRGAFLNWRFAVNGIQKAACSRSEPNSARLFMQRHYTAVRCTKKGSDPFCLSLVSDDALLLHAQMLDVERHDVARLQEHRRRLDAEAHPRRGAGGDDVSGKQRHVL